MSRRRQTQDPEVTAKLLRMRESFNTPLYELHRGLCASLSANLSSLPRAARIVDISATGVSLTFIREGETEEEESVLLFANPASTIPEVRERVFELVEEARATLQIPGATRNPAPIIYPSLLDVSTIIALLYLLFSAARLLPHSLRFPALVRSLNLIVSPAVAYQITLIAIIIHVAEMIAALATCLYRHYPLVPTLYYTIGSLLLGYPVFLPLLSLDT